MSTIQVREQHIDEEQATSDVLAVVAQDLGAGTEAREIHPETAVTIASWCQSPGSVGNKLASFASGAEVDRTELLDDIAATRREQGYGTARMERIQERALDCLSTFVINYPQGEGLVEIA